MYAARCQNGLCIGHFQVCTSVGTCFRLDTIIVQPFRYAFGKETVLVVGGFGGGECLGDGPGLFLAVFVHFGDGRFTGDLFSVVDVLHVEGAVAREDVAVTRQWGAVLCSAGVDFATARILFHPLHEVVQLIVHKHLEEGKRQGIGLVHVDEPIAVVQLFEFVGHLFVHTG